MAIKDEANKKYRTALKRAKILSEAEAGTADPAKIKEIQGKLSGEWMPRLDAAKLKLKEASDSLKQIEEEDFDSEFLGWLDINDSDDSQGHKAF